MQLVVRILFVLCISQIISSSPLEDGDKCEAVPYSNLCVKLGSKYYLIDGNTMINWFEAERFCRRQGGFLTDIGSANELRLISNYLLSQGYQGRDWFWISGNDLGSEANFYSIATGSLLQFTSWTSGQPDNAGENENCVHLWKHGDIFKMNDWICDQKAHFICELENLNLITEIPLFDVRRDWLKSDKADPSDPVVS